MNKKNQYGFASLGVLLVFVTIVGVSLFAFIRMNSETTTSDQELVTQPEEKHSTIFNDLTIIPDPSGYKVSADIVCAEGAFNTNFRIVETILDENNTPTIICESYQTEQNTCYEQGDKAEMNGKPCVNTSDGPYNRVQVYTKNEETGIYFASYLSPTKSIPESYRREGGYWVSVGRRSQVSIPDIESRRIGETNYYTYSTTHPCTLSTACGIDEQNTLYYRINDEVILQMNFLSFEVLKGHGG